MEATAEDLKPGTLVCFSQTAPKSRQRQKLVVQDATGENSPTLVLTSQPSEFMAK